MLTTHKQRILEIIGTEFEITRGRALPLGATAVRGGVNFAIFSRNATSVTLVIYRAGDLDPIAEFPMDSRRNRTGDVWHVFIGGIDPGIEYGYRIDRVPNLEPHLHRFNPSRVLLDPYARGTSRADGERRSVIIDSQFDAQSDSQLESHFDWEQDQPLDLRFADSVIYEVHVGAFTRNHNAGTSSPGTFAGLVEKIPYFRDLGITAIELMPIMEFDEADNPRINPLTGERLINNWGYHPLSFCSPHLAYGVSGSPRDTLREMKEMVKAFHAAGIEVILDAVFNHTGEGRAPEDWFSFRGIDNNVYYMLVPETGEDRNFSGCGNTLNCNHPVVRDFILDCLRYWVIEVHVDGFRFDLASILGRGPDGSVLSNPPLIEQIAVDPVLANTKLIAEAWDASGLYQVGSFPAGQRWAEWNGKFRDDLRRYVRGDAGMVPMLATRLAGSSDLYQGNGRAPYHSINFVTCHDGFTMADLVCYDGKHNESNGEENRDGCNDNFSWNCGVEGTTSDVDVLQLRRRQVKNLAALLFLAHGVPMLLYGDEVGRTQGGNNNVYCHDALSRMDWDLVDEDRAQLVFFQHLIAFRRAHRVLRRGSFVPTSDEPMIRMDWNGRNLGQPDWNCESRALALHISEREGDAVRDSIYLITNAHWEGSRFELPQIAGQSWARFLDTSLTAPDDIVEPGREVELEEQTCYHVGPRSTVVLVGRTGFRA
jgi:isoamylase